MSRPFEAGGWAEQAANDRFHREADSARDRMTADGADEPFVYDEHGSCRGRCRGHAQGNHHPLCGGSRRDKP